MAHRAVYEKLRAASQKYEEAGPILRKWNGMAEIEKDAFMEEHGLANEKMSQKDWQQLLFC